MDLPDRHNQRAICCVVSITVYIGSIRRGSERAVPVNCVVFGVFVFASWSGLGWFGIVVESVSYGDRVMDRRVDPQNVACFLPSLVLLLQNVVDSMFRPEDTIPPDERDASGEIGQVHDTLINMNSIIASVLHDFRIAHATTLLDQELGWWVMPRSTSWFSRFVLQEYDDSRWLENFRMTKASVFSLTNLLQRHIERQDTHYRLAIPPIVRVAYTLFKLCQGASLLLCSEFFAIGTSTTSGIIRDVVKAVKDELRGEISWPTGNKLQVNMAQFREFSGLPGIVGAIDDTHFHIRKPNISP